MVIRQEEVLLLDIAGIEVLLEFLSSITLALITLTLLKYFYIYINKSCARKCKCPRFISALYLQSNAKQKNT